MANMAFDVVPVDQVEDDFRDIYLHLIKSYLEFGEGPPEAIERANLRILALKERMYGLWRTPYQGTLLSKVRIGLRRATKEDGVYYFEVDDCRKQLIVLAVFFSGQDHLPQIMARLKGARG
jgi:hypothetical protein